MASIADRAIVRCANADEWWAWLAEHHASSPGIRLAVAKKNAAHKGVRAAEALEAALCFGWIDGALGKLDDDFFLQAYSRRGPQSIWSRINREHALRLIDAGRMQPSGLLEVVRARADGRWDAAYASQRTMEVPPDLAVALAADPAAAAFFEKLDRQNRFAVLFRVTGAKRPETRARRIAAFVDMLSRGETLHPRPGVRSAHPRPEDPR